MIWLTELKQFGPVKQRELLTLYDNDPEKVYQAVKNKDEKIRFCKGISDRLYSVLCAQTDLREAESILMKCRGKNIQIVAREDLTENFRKYDDLPIMLYVKGKKMDLKKPGIAIVGARRCSRTAKNSAIMLAIDAVAEGNTVVSGMAKGIDSYAHTAVIRDDYNGNTIAVLGNGVDICYPKEHEPLYQAIQSHGVLVSEYPPGTEPNRFTFPNRNRIIAALSKQIYIIEASRNSGTHTTAEAAGRYGVPYEYWP